MMEIKVHILATCLDGRLNPALLVFRTLRIGFPNADVTVFGNALGPSEAVAVKSACAKSGAKFVSLNQTSHDTWIESLLQRSPVPFWICDTDMVFHASVEGLANESTVLKGRYEPPFVEPWSKTLKAARLHTSLLYMNAPELRRQICAWMRHWHPGRFPFTPNVELIRQCYIPRGAGLPPTFQDTCSGLYQALGGEPFTEEENSRFDHLHCGTYVDRMRETIPGLGEAHRQIYAHPEDGKLLKENQAEFYKRHEYA